MAPNVLAWLWPVVFYLIGSFPTGYLVGRACGLDVRQHGSGNIGATNVSRVMGRGWGLSVFAIDFFKGFFPLFFLQREAFPHDVAWITSLLIVLCGWAVILGHNYTPWLGFKGGKGVATSGGVLGALLPWSLGSVLLLWIVAVSLTRVVSVGSLLAALALPLATWYFYPHQVVDLGLACLISILVVYSHRTNIQRLLAGTEARLGSTKKSP